jgi:uncharacterized protein
MNRIDGRLVLSPSDLVGGLTCEHLTQLELAVTRGALQRPVRVDPELDLLVRRGEAHERAQLLKLGEGRGWVAEIPDHEESLAGLQAAEAETFAAMRAGADVIYQAAFFDGAWRGRADFLLRVDVQSDLGLWSYEVADAKLARSVRVAALLQMCEYSIQVERLQGRAPERMHVLLGDGTQESHRVADFAAYHRFVRRQLEEIAAGPPLITYPEPVDHCGVCRWHDQCAAQRRADDHLSLVAGMRRDQTRHLVAAGIPTMAALACAPETPAPDIGEGPWHRLRQQARLQLAERTAGAPAYELLPLLGPGLGLAALPPPSRGDLFFDMEGDPFVVDGGLEYLFGVTEVAGGAPQYHAFWAHDRAEEKAAFEALVDFAIERLDRDPDLHVYHYASYEPAALKRLMGRHGTREDEVDRLLRGGVLVDLYQVVRQGVRVSRESYSLKSLEAFYMAKRGEEIADAAGSIVAYEQWLEARDQSLLDAIAAYNERDCESTRLLRDWLEARRQELAVQIGSPVPRPPVREGLPSAALAQATADTQGLAAALTAGLSEERSVRTDEEQARWLLAQLLEWHRREEKSGWWAYYTRCAMTDEELVEDSEAIGAIGHLGEVRSEKRSTVHRYAFDPAQDHKLDIGDKPHDPMTGRAAGEIVAIDHDRGVLELKRGPSHAGADQPTSLIPQSPIATTAKRQALQRVAAWVAGNGIGGPGKYSAIRHLVVGAAPQLREGGTTGTLVPPGEDPVAVTCRLVSDLDGSYLAVQGPPGCGKTYTAAHVVVDLVARGRRVGVSAMTHRAIGTLLEAVCEVAEETGQPVRILQRCAEGEECGPPGVHRAADNAAVGAALAAGEVDVVAGTSWLFADHRLDDSLDVLVIDEAGQMSLADACAAGTAAHNLILLGDPQQLAQPTQGIHPEGAEVSGLGHVLGGRDTIPPDRGVFLPTTWRMHPAVCGFVSTAFYDGRLTSDPSCSGRRLVGWGDREGVGLRRVAVEHTGNRTWSAEEVATVRRLVDDLQRAAWVDGERGARPLTLPDILVVAPYNAQVQRLRAALPVGARVGTVDKFQGQEAPVTIYSMTTSSAEDLPRNLEFLFSGNRLNVAVSRAQALSIVVLSPHLLRARCRTPEQLRLVNTVCLYVESAHEVAGELTGIAGQPEGNSS